MRSFVKVLNNCLCSEAFLNVLAVPLAMLLWKMRLRLEAVMTLAMCWTSMLARRGIKPLVDRPRPSVLLVLVKNQSRGKSFPSGDVASCESVGLDVCARTASEARDANKEKVPLESSSAAGSPRWPCTDLPGRPLGH